MTIRTRIIVVFVIVVSAGFFFLVQWIAGDLRPRYLESLEEPLVDTAHVLAELVADELDDEGRPTVGLREAFSRVYERRFQAQVYALQKEAVDLRIYVTDKQGLVVFDSDGGRDEGRDYSRWNDVYLTLRGQYGARSSHDDPSAPEGSVKYVAAPILKHGQIAGVITVGKPARNVNQFIDAAKSKFYVAGALAALGALVLGLIMYRWVSRPLDRLVRYAEGVKSGARVSLPELGNNEMGMMGAAMEEMRSVLEGKDYAQQYVQTLTHELKSPLAAIRGAAELLDENMPEAQRQRFLTNIRTEVVRIQNLIDRMLALAALEKRQSLESIETIALSALVEKLVESLRPVWTGKAIAIDNRIDPATRVRGDAFLLGQAIENLLRNAVAFSPRSGKIVLEAEMRESNVVLSVRDHGTGIPDYALSRVFERFYSIAPPESSTKGTGLGLSFVREVAELHGGKIELRNADTTGVIARLTVPARG